MQVAPDCPQGYRGTAVNRDSNPGGVPCSPRFSLSVSKNMEPPWGSYCLLFRTPGGGFAATGGYRRKTPTGYWSRKRSQLTRQTHPNVAARSLALVLKGACPHAPRRLGTAALPGPEQQLRDMRPMELRHWPKQMSENNGRMQ